MNDSIQNQTEEPEGIDNPDEDGSGGYPLNDVLVRTQPRTVKYIVEKIDQNRIILDPDFQRVFLWSVTKQSKLIESCIMRIPLPVFYVAEAIDGRIIVVDGLQRITSFHRYINNEFRLTGLDSSDHPSSDHELEGKYFKDLPINYRERIEDTPLILYILDAKAPERARLDIFDRVNSGEPLTRQQMRNALYSGPATAWLRDAANGQAFKNATDSKLNQKTMRDREAINRFCAFKLLGTSEYKGDMDSFLARGLTALQDMQEEDRERLREKFDRAMNLSHEIFGGHAFRKSMTWGPDEGRSVINISLFEVCAVTMCELNNLTDHQKDSLCEAIIELMGDTEGFVHAISYSTNSTTQVQKRFSMMADAVAKVAGATG